MKALSFSINKKEVIEKEKPKVEKTSDTVLKW